MQCPISALSGFIYYLFRDVVFPLDEDPVCWMSPPFAKYFLFVFCAFPVSDT